MKEAPHMRKDPQVHMDTSPNVCEWIICAKTGAAKNTRVHGSARNGPVACYDNYAQGVINVQVL